VVHPSSDVDEDSLLLWKVSIPIDRLEKAIGSLDLKDDDILMPDVEFSDIFFGQPNPDHLHIVIKGPSECNIPFYHCSVPLYCSPLNYLLTAPDLLTGPPPDLRRTLSSPSLDLGSDIINRHVTVNALYERLDMVGLVQVRSHYTYANLWIYLSDIGSGYASQWEDVLPICFTKYILQCNPEVNVVFIPEWKIKEWPCDYYKQFKSYGWKSETKNILIIDEAQATYTDAPLWHFLKNVTSYSYERVILFCRYGNPTPQRDIVVRTIINEDQLISMRPMNELRFGCTPVGLLLAEDEFEDLVSNWCLRSNLDDSLLNTIFKLTAGHIGGIVGFIDVIRASDVCFLLVLRVKGTHSLPGIPSAGELQRASHTRTFLGRHPT